MLKAWAQLTVKSADYIALSPKCVFALLQWRRGFKSWLARADEDPKRSKQRSTSAPGYFHTKPFICLKTAADALQQIYSIHGDVTTPSVNIFKNLLGQILPYYLPYLHVGSSDSLQPGVLVIFMSQVATGGHMLVHYPFLFQEGV